MNDHVITITERAQQVLKNQDQQVRAATSAWVHDSDSLEHILKMSETLRHAQTSILTGGFGPATLHWDDELSLLVSTGITIGMIFFPKDRPDIPEEHHIRLCFGPEPARMGLYCMHDIAGIGPCRQPIVKGEHPEHAEHAPEPCALPLLGTWSLHS